MSWFHLWIVDFHQVNAGCCLIRAHLTIREALASVGKLVDLNLNSELGHHYFALALSLLVPSVFV